MKTINAYEFSELNEHAKKRVLEDLTYINVEDNWYEHLIDCWTRELEEEGFEDAKISFSGFGSQGDGCSFKGYLNLEKHLVNEFAELKKHECQFVFREYPSYTRYRRWKIEVENYTDNEAIGSLLDRFESHINSIKENLEKNIYKELMDEYYHLTSNEEIIHTIEANDYHFLENGTQI